MTKKATAIICAAGGVLTLGCIGTALGGKDKENTSSDVSSSILGTIEDSSKIYTVDEFCIRFENEDDFAHDHKDQIFTISGTIDDKVYKTLYFESNIESEKWYGNYSIHCKFEDKEILESLDDGFEVTFNGKLNSFSTSTITLENCTLVAFKKPADESLIYNESKLPAEKEYNYDALQNIFISITQDTTNIDLQKFISENSLCFTTKEYNKASGGKSLNYKIAYTQGAAAQSHADSGDYLDIDFDNDTKLLESAHYVKNGSFVSALFYNSGTYYDFSDENSEEYAGYYISDPFAGNSGITIKYKNGSETKTNFFKYESAEETINFVIDSVSESSSESSNSVESSAVSSSTIESEPQSTIQDSESRSEVSSIPSSISSPEQSSEPPVVQQKTYVLNTSTKKVHKPSCRDVEKIDYENRGSATSSELDDYIEAGYTACGHCHPF